MFYYVKGKLALCAEDFAVVDCKGVGYKLSVSATTIGKIAHSIGEEVLLYTYLAVREDAMELYGFFAEEELHLFKLLIAVSGIGPKSALAILSRFSPGALQQIIYSGDAKSLSAAPGVGTKTAQRIVMELHDKMGAVSDSPLKSADMPFSGKSSAVIDTLTLYGFDRRQIEAALKQQDLSEPLENLIANTLRTLGNS